LSLNETLPQSSPMAMLMKKMANFTLCRKKRSHADDHLIDPHVEPARKRNLRLQ
jgi:hypothetical protein